MSTAMRVKRSTLRALALVAPAEDASPPATWKLMEKNGRRGRGKTATPDGASDVGTLLRTTRRRRRISLDKASRETCIPRRYLEALERNEPASVFPGMLYARGFLRAYARYLRFADERELLALFEPDVPAPIEMPVEVVPPPDAARRRRTRLAVLALVLATAIVSVATGERSHPVRASLPVVVPTVATAPSAEQNLMTPVVPVASTTPSLTLEVAGTSWIRVVADGTTILPGRTLSSLTRGFSARRTLTIVAGNAAAVRLLFDGAWRGPLGLAGQVVRITVTLREGVPVLRVTPVR